MSIKVIVLGSHKGLGHECVKSLINISKVKSVLGLSRHDSNDFLNTNKYQFKSFDFTQAYSDEKLYQELLTDVSNFKANYLIYCAGGGPHGKYEAKDWKDHEWALKLNFLFPAKLIWSILKRNQDAKELVQSPFTFLYIGSAIAESDQGDSLGPSYAAAKWAMKGLIKSLNGTPGSINIKIISPGYMNTTLLPLGSAPRSSNQDILDVKDVVKEIFSQLEL